MNHYVVREHESMEAVFVVATEHQWTSSSGRIEKITKPEFETYVAFGIPEKTLTEAGGAL